ncbi:DUF5606 domain-containing protein [Cyclobacteriaceae bacterium]|nr:DUF5606 domain-containing protein [Cyclobacteriaceae bacterium]
MDLKDVASIAGKGGLFKVVKPTRTGVILETLDDSQKKIVANANSRVSILKEISIYTTSAEGTVLLEEVFKIIHEKYNKELPVSSKASSKELFDFLREIVPDFDEEKVYPSDAKKVVSWYNMLLKHYPSQFEFDKEEKETETKKEA